MMGHVYTLPHRRSEHALSGLTSPRNLTPPDGGLTATSRVECITRKWGLF